MANNANILLNYSMFHDLNIFYFVLNSLEAVDYER